VEDDTLRGEDALEGRMVGGKQGKIIAYWFPKDGSLERKQELG